ncbi:ABC transporter permease [Streptomyces sedi]
MTLIARVRDDHTMTEAAQAPEGRAPLAPSARPLPALAAVYRAQLSRARVARMPLLFVATFQSVGIMILMRGVVDGGAGAEANAVVAGSSVLVVAFVALNLLAQYFGQLRTGGLDHYATLPVPAAAVVLGTAAAYASFTVPGVAVTAVTGALLYQLPLGGLWLLLAVVPLAGAALAGLGAALGLLAPRPELATLAGQLGMSAALLLGVLPAGRLPEPLRWTRELLPSSYGVDALAEMFEPAPDAGLVVAHLGVCAGVGVLALALATWAYRRAARA